MWQKIRSLTVSFCRSSMPCFTPPSAPVHSAPYSPIFSSRASRSPYPALSPPTAESTRSKASTCSHAVIARRARRGPRRCCADSDGWQASCRVLGLSWNLEAAGGQERRVDGVNDVQTGCDGMRLLTHDASAREGDIVVRAVEGGGYGGNRGGGEVSTLCFSFWVVTRQNPRRLGQLVGTRA